MAVLFRFIFPIAFVFFSTLAFSDESMSVALDGDNEFHVQAYPASGESLMLVMPSEHGITEGLTSLAKKLSENGIEVWLADPFTTWFLPTVESSLNEIPVLAYTKLIAKAVQSGKNIYLMSNDKAVKVLLESAREWQLNSNSFISGVFLISPDLYTRTPTAGNDGEFLPIAKATNLPVYIYVPSKSTLALRIKDTVNVLEEGGSDVYVQVLPDVRNRFFFRPDATETEQSASTVLPERITQGMKLIGKYAKHRKPVSLAKSGYKNNVKNTGKLREYTGEFHTENFTLDDVMGNTHSLSQYRGKVVIVNFWASWCPPCVHEMPSMSKLYDEMSGKPFTILAINLGEKAEDIKMFLKSYPVNFPVLLDPLSAIPKKWKVFAFPTSYLLDRNGVVRYSIAGGIDWDTEEIKEVINNLVADK